MKTVHVYSVCFYLGDIMYYIPLAAFARTQLRPRGSVQKGTLIYCRLLHYSGKTRRVPDGFARARRLLKSLSLSPSVDQTAGSARIVCPGALSHRRGHETTVPARHETRSPSQTVPDMALGRVVVC